MDRSDEGRHYVAELEVVYNIFLFVQQPLANHRIQVSVDFHLYSVLSHLLKLLDRL